MVAGPLVPFHISSIWSMRPSSFFASSRSTVRLTCEACLDGLPAHVVQVRELLEVLGLEVVVPHHVDVVLGELRALLLDVRQRARNTSSEDAWYFSMIR